MPKGKDLYTFVRFGGLDLKTQKGFGKNTFHSPPAARGFYAMPKAFQELFLIGSLERTQPYNFPKCPTWKENETEEEKEYRDNWDWDKQNKREKKVKTQIRREFRKTTGYIWHHLDYHIPINEVITRHNSWVKTTIQAWVKAIEKETLNNRYGNNNEYLKTNSVNNAYVNGIYSKDHFEVFFDEKV